ncbi:MAG: glutathione S-transferase family protein [Pseudomonadota bacterium]
MASYRLFGAETSPYSLKVRSYLRYKNLPFDWIARSKATEAEFTALAKSPTVPLLVDEAGAAMQDSTDMLALLEKAGGEPAATPEDPACRALSLILEDYADEWLNKAMFHQRWSQSPDRDAAALRVLNQLFDGAPPKDSERLAKSIGERMADRLSLVGAQAENGPVLAASFRRFAELLNAHLEQRLFLFGGRPSAADFALAGQLQQMLLDPTPAEFLRDRAPFVAAWCEFMEDPKPGAPFEGLDTAGETLAPIFKDEIAAGFLPWAEANSQSITKRRKTTRVELEDGVFEQATQRYAAKSWRAVKKAVEKAAKAKDGAPLMDFLKATACEQAIG